MDGPFDSRFLHFKSLSILERGQKFAVFVPVKMFLRPRALMKRFFPFPENTDVSARIFFLRFCDVLLHIVMFTTANFCAFYAFF